MNVAAVDYVRPNRGPENGVGSSSGPEVGIRGREDSLSAPGTTGGNSPSIANSALSVADSDSASARIDEILYSEIGVSILLSRLKHSITSCREFASFLRKRATIEEDHAQGLRKLCKLTTESVKRLEGRQGTYLRQFDETTRIHDRIAENGIQFSLALHLMHEELSELATNMERGRKHWKAVGLAAEKKVNDSEQQLERCKAKYSALADEYERVRAGDKRGVFGRGFTRTGPQVEEDIRQKVLAADQEYASKVQITNAHRQELFNVLRPQTVKALRDLAKECDSGLTFQLQKFANLNERLMLSNGLCINPIKGQPGEPEIYSMREVVGFIDDEKDFNSFVLSLSSRLQYNSKPLEIRYEKHPSLSLSSFNPQSSQSGLADTQRENPNTSQHQFITPKLSILSQPQQPYNHQPFQPHNQSQTSFPELPPVKPVFGVSLDELLDRDKTAVPIIVYQCIQAVDLYGLDVEGIYRLSGTASNMQRLKIIFDNDAQQVDFRRPEDFFHDVNSVASVLKQFFRELPEPLLTKERYPKFIQAARIEDDTKRRDTLHAIINSLPDPNYATLRALILHLHRVQDRAATNRMHTNNLAIFFGPTLMSSTATPDINDAGWQVKVIDTVLRNCFSIFEPDD